MADEVIATTKIRLEADTAGLKQQAERAVNESIPKVVPVKLDLAKEAESVLTTGIAAQTQKMDDLLTQAQTQAFKGVASRARGDEAGALLAEFRSEVLSVQATVEQMGAAQKTALKMASGSQGLMRDQLLAAADAFAAGAERLRQEEARLRAQGPARPGAPDVGGGARVPLGQRLGQLTGGAGGGLGQLLRAGGRLGLIGFAATSAFQAVSELQQSLRVTGNEAFTAEGKLRNLGAELLSGNIIGGIKAITAERKAEFVGGLGDQIKAEIEKEKTAKDPLIITEEKLAAVRQKGKDAVKEYVLTLIAFNKISLEQAVALVKVNQNLEAQQQIVEASASAWANYQQQVEKAGGSLERAFGPDSRSGLHGPGGVAAGRPTTAGTPVFQAGSGGTDVAAQIRASINSRIQDEQTIATARVREATITQKIAKESFETAKKNVQAGAAAAGSAADEWLKYVQATTEVVLATENADSVAKQAAAAGQQLGNSVRDAWVSAISDPAAQAQAALKAQKIRESQAKSTFESAKKGTKEANDAWAAWQIERAKTAGIEGSIAETAKNAAKAAAETAKNAKEQALQNDIAYAELTGDTPRIKRAYQAAIAYWKAIAANTKLAADVREAAEANVISLTASLKQVGGGRELRDLKLQNDLAEAELKGLDTRPFLQAIIAFAKGVMDGAKKGTEAYETARGVLISARQNFKSTNQTLNDLKRQNARARAALTETSADDEKLIRADIRYWSKRVAATKGMGIVHQKAIAELLKAEGDMKTLLDDVKPTTTVFDLLTDATKAFSEHAGNIINAGNRFTGDAFTSGIRGQIGTSPNAAGRIRLGLDDRHTTAVERNTAALDRNTSAREPRGHPPALGGGGGGTSGSGGWGGSGRWGGWAWSEAAAAAGARGGIN